MRICVYGAGAIGGYLGAQLALAGEDVTLRLVDNSVVATRGAIHIAREAVSSDLFAGGELLVGGVLSGSHAVPADAGLLRDRGGRAPLGLCEPRPLALQLANRFLLEGEILVAQILVAHGRRRPVGGRAGKASRVD